MRLRSVIVDDEEIGIETLRVLIEKHCRDVKVVASSMVPGEAVEIIEDYKPDIVFLDISMPEMDGFELLKNLAWKEFHLIFTTAHQEYALKAIKESALDYLLKPVDPNDLRAAIDRVRRQLLDQQKYLSDLDLVSLNKVNLPTIHKLALSSRHSVEAVDAHDIICFESRSNYTLVNLCNAKPVLTPKTLGEFEIQLCDPTGHFMRVHHSFVINLRHVSRFIKENDTIIMTNNQKVPLSRSRKESFLKWMNGLGNK